MIDIDDIQPVLCMYNLRKDKERLLKYFPYAECFDDKMSVDERVELLERWNRGEVPLLLAHPMQIAHGVRLNLEKRNVVWYGSSWSPIALSTPSITSQQPDEDSAPTIASREDVEKAIVKYDLTDPWDVLDFVYGNEK